MTRKLTVCFSCRSVIHVGESGGLGAICCGRTRVITFFLETNNTHAPEERQHNRLVLVFSGSSAAQSTSRLRAEKVSD